MRKIYRRSQKGFTLIEIALGLLIISIVIYGSINSFSDMYEFHNYRSSTTSLKYAKKSLLRFVEINHFMPCPDVDGDGKEDRNGSACSSFQGNLPYQDLGMEPSNAKDSWGVPLKYAVASSATDMSSVCNATPRRVANYFCNLNAPLYDDLTPPTASETDPSTLSINVSNDNSSAYVFDQLVAVIYSLGKDPNPQNPDEVENIDGDNDFVQKKYSDDPYFDDQVMPISGYEIKRPQDYSASGAL